MLNKSSIFRVFSPEETNSTTYSKGYWVSDIVSFTRNSLLVWLGKNNIF